jgi:hypothetical protein
VSTAADLVTSVRAATDQVVSGPVDDPTILGFLNDEYPVVRRLVAQLVPDLFASESGDLVVASGASEIDVSGLANLDLIFEVKRLSGSSYLPFDQAGEAPQISIDRVWRRRGMSGAGTVIEVYPTTSAPGTYRVRYMATAAPLITTGGGSPNTVLLPAGGERVLVEAAAARVRDRLERDYTFNYRARDEALGQLAISLQQQGYVIKGRSGRGR